MLRPHAFAPRISAISLDDLDAAGIRGLIVDLDDTLVGHKWPHPDERDSAWIAAAVERGIKIVLVSNNVRAWVESIATPLKVGYVHNALKPFPGGFGRALQMLGTEKRQTLVVGDQVFTDLLGASLFGLRAILTDPLVVRSDFWMKTLRWLERRVTRRPIWPDEGKT
ncbi:MAG: YqeG family HAD IIIA-type phosphatase [Candidatus Eremiobacteraeota bacterium]|nr:YqeG family HAD IIIA-type phosphatase [Candidatus Eremiobacteraeota bacterium]